MESHTYVHAYDDAITRFTNFAMLFVVLIFLEGDVPQSPYRLLDLYYHSDVLLVAATG